MENTDSLTRLTYENCKNRFNSQAAADIYRTRHVTSRKGKREMACIRAALAELKRPALILDLPCGTGRLTHYIQDLGFQVVGADYSSHMVEHAKAGLKESDNIRFEQQDILDIKHPNGTFDAAVCNRLFHHYPTSQLRQLALRELMRVTKGPLIVSFFNSLSLSAVWSKMKNVIRNKKPIDRVPISFFQFKQDIEACGLRIEASYYCRFGLSPQTYLKLIKRPE